MTVVIFLVCRRNDWQVFSVFSCASMIIMQKLSVEHLSCNASNCIVTLFYQACFLVINLLFFSIICIYIYISVYIYIYIIYKEFLPILKSNSVYTNGLRVFSYVRHLLNDKRWGGESLHDLSPFFAVARQRVFILFCCYYCSLFICSI